MVVDVIGSQRPKYFRIKAQADSRPHNSRKHYVMGEDRIGVTAAIQAFAATQGVDVAL